MSSDRAPWAGRPVAIVHDWFQGFHGAERIVAAMRGRLRPRRPADVFTFHAARELLPPSWPARDRPGVAARAGCRGCASAATTPGAGAACCPTCRTTSSISTSTATSSCSSSSHACAVNVRPPPETSTSATATRRCATSGCPSTERERVSGVKGVGAAGAARAAAPARPARRAAARRLPRQLDRGARPDPAASTAATPIVVHPPVASTTSRATSERERDALPLGPPAGPLQAPARGRRGVPRAARPAPDDGRDRPARGGAARAAARRTSSCAAGSRASELAELFAGAAGFIHVGEEDFGISMVEALAAGAPVLAPTPAARATSSATESTGCWSPTRPSIRCAPRSSGSAPPSGTATRSPRAPLVLPRRLRRPDAGAARGDDEMRANSAPSGSCSRSARGSSVCCGGSRASEAPDAARRRLLGRRVQRALRRGARRRPDARGRGLRAPGRGSRSEGDRGGAGRPRNRAPSLGGRERRRRRLQPGPRAPEERLAADDRDVPGAAARRPRGPLGPEPGRASTTASCWRWAASRPRSASSAPTSAATPSASSASSSAAAAPTRSSAPQRRLLSPAARWSGPLSRLWPAPATRRSCSRARPAPPPPWSDYIEGEVEGGMQTFYG